MATSVLDCSTTMRQSLRSDWVRDVRAMPSPPFSTDFSSAVDCSNTPICDYVRYVRASCSRDVISFAVVVASNRSCQRRRLEENGVTNNRFRKARGRIAGDRCFQPADLRSVGACCSRDLIRFAVVLPRVDLPKEKGANSRFKRARRKIDTYAAPAYLSAMKVEVGCQVLLSPSAVWLLTLDALGVGKVAGRQLMPEQSIGRESLLPSLLSFGAGGENPVSSYSIR